MNDRMIESIIESERSFTVINRSIIRRRGKITRIKYLFFEHHKIFLLLAFYRIPKITGKKIAKLIQADQKRYCVLS
ncbi:MAG: hypothetical protein ACI90V_007424 [Bacillariaceae sp.]|jgi:hypothetical protein